MIALKWFDAFTVIPANFYFILKIEIDCGTLLISFPESDAMFTGISHGFDLENAMA